MKAAHLLQLQKRFSVFFIVIEDLKVDLSILKFLHRNTSRLSFSRVHFDSGQSSALDLLASLSGQDDHSIFRIYIGRIDDLFGLFFDNVCILGHKCGLLSRQMMFRHVETIKNTANCLHLSIATLSLSDDDRAQLSGR